MKKNPFGDHEPPKSKVNPFGEELAPGSIGEAALRMEQAARKIRLLKGQIGAEGLTLQAYRDLMDEVSAALEAGSRAITDLDKKS